MSAADLMGEMLRQRQQRADEMREAQSRRPPPVESVPLPSKEEVVGEDRYNWARSYEFWRKWDDAETKRDELQAEHQRNDRLAELGPMEQCNHDRSAERRLFEMKPAEQEAEAREFKSLGDAYLAEGQFGRAMQAYERALVVFVYAFPEGDAEQRFAELETVINLNAAAAALKAMQWDKALAYCARAESLGCSNPKLFFRRAVALRERSEFDAARAALARALELAPGDASCVQEQAILAKKEAAYRVRSKQLASRLFAGGLASHGALESEVEAAAPTPGEAATEASEGPAAGGEDAAVEEEAARHRQAHEDAVSADLLAPSALAALEDWEALE